VAQHANKQGVPAGSWHVTVTGSTGADVFAKTVKVRQNPSNPATIELTSGLNPGSSYNVSADFVPDSRIADGYKVTNGTPQKTTVAAESIGQTLTTKIMLPGWGLGAIGLGLAALIVAAIVLITRRRVVSSMVNSGESRDDEAPTASAPTPQAASQSAPSE